MTVRVVIERNKPSLATLWLENAMHYNALSDTMLHELIAAITTLGEDTDCRNIVLRGRGGVFCAGRELRDVRALQAGDIEAVKTTYEAMRRLNEVMYRSKLPIICLIEKYAFGGGMMLASWSDIAIAEEGALLGYPEIFNGITPWAAVPVMVQELGRKATMDLVLTGRQVPAEEAVRMGLITRSVPKDRLEEALGDTLAAINRGSHVAVAKTRAFVRECEQLDYSAGMSVAADKGCISINSPELREGIAAFLGKREPKWRGV